MRRLLMTMALGGLALLASPALAQQPTPIKTHPPAEIPDDGCTSIPQIGGCEAEEAEDDDEETPAPSPDPSGTPGSPAVSPTAQPSAAPAAPSPAPAPSLAPTPPPTTAPSLEPEPIESLIPSIFIERDKEEALPEELAFTGPSASLLIGLGIGALALIVLGLYARGEGQRQGREEQP